MNKLFPRILRPRSLLTFIFALGVALLFWPARVLRSDNFVFYFPHARHVLPLEVIEHANYLPLLQVLNLVGKVSGWQEKRDTLKAWFGNTQLELHLNDKKVRLNKTWVTLSDPVRVANGQWMVPVDFLTSALPKLTREPIEYQVGTRRIFIGEVKPNSFTVRLDQVSNGARLTLQFTDKVSVRSAARNGKWVLYLGERPVEPLEQTFRFQDPYVSQLQFDDQDGSPKLILTPAAGGLNFYPALVEEGKVLLADVLKPPPLVPQPRETATGAAPTPPPSASTAEAPAKPPGPPLPVVVLDAGHGGEDAGAHSRDGVLEKDLVAQLVNHVRLALLATEKYRVVLTRVGDTSTSFDQRDTAANMARAGAFLSFHAGTLGGTTPRVIVYTYQFSSSPAFSLDEEPRQLFVPWSKVQQNHLGLSRVLAEALQQQFGLIPGVEAHKPAAAPVRALRSVDAPAVAIEIGSLSPDEDSGALTSPAFQQQISAAIVRALELFRRGPG